MAWRGGEYAITASAVALDSALSITDTSEFHWKMVDMRNAPGAANDCYLGNSDVTTSANRHVILEPGDSYTFSQGDGTLIDIREIYVIGTVNAANKLFISLR